MLPKSSRFRKSFFPPICIALIIPLLFSTLRCLGQHHAPANHWQSLFDGKDLQGWHPTGGGSPFSVEHGEIIATSTAGQAGSSFLVTDQNYGDFFLQLDFMADSTLSSGIQLRSQASGNQVTGYQAVIDPSSRAWTGAIQEIGGRGWLYPLTLNPPARKAFHQAGWNHLYIECIGNTIRTWINGVPAANLVDTVSTGGVIGLDVGGGEDPASEGGKVRFRHILIQTARLNTKAPDQIFVVNNIPNTLSAQEKKNGFQLLWDGTTTTGWRGIFHTGFPTKGWEIHDGVLTIHNSNGHEEGSGGDVITDREFGAFELEFEFKYSYGANSGVKYDVKESYNPDGKSGIGLEYQILDDAHHPDAKLGRNGDRTLSSLYDLIPRKDIPDAFKSIGEWNRGRIIVYPDGHTEHWLNGFKMLEYEKGSKEFLALVAISKYKVWKGFGTWKTGHILLQDHGNEASFRSIKIKVF